MNRFLDSLVTALILVVAWGVGAWAMMAVAGAPKFEALTLTGICLVLATLHMAGWRESECDV